MGEATLIRLAAISEAYKLGLEDKCYERSARENGMSAALAHAQAISCLVAGKPDRGLELFEEAQAKADPDGKSLEWRLNRVQYLDQVQSPRAAIEVVSLGDDYPKDVRVQRTILSTIVSARKNRDFMDRTIQRFRDLTGEQGVTWRIARGRWLLDFTTTPEDSEQAIKLLTEASQLSPDLVEVHLLLARAFEKVGKTNDAIEQLTTAADLNPASTSIGLYLANLLEARGDFERAREQLQRVTATPLSNPDQRRQAAMLLAQQGDSQRAIDMLEEADRQSGSGNDDFLLAQLYQQRNELTKADAICKELLQKPTPAVIQFAADLFATEGRQQEANQVLALLDGMKLEPGVRELILADFSARHRTPEAALELFQSATRLAPKDPTTWRSLIVFELAAGKYSDARMAVEEGLNQLPDEKSLLALHDNWDLLGLAEVNPIFIPIAMDFVRNPLSGSPASEVLHAVFSSRQQSESPEQLSERLAPFGNRYPRFLSLQLLLANTYLQAGLIDSAIIAATQAKEVSPKLEEPYRLLTAAFGTSGRWAEALDAAQQWREHTLDRPLAADLAIADVEMKLNQPAAAMAQLLPYVRDPQSPFYLQVFPIYTNAKANAEHANPMPLLEPLLTRGAAGRRSWILFAMQNLDPNEAAIWLERAYDLMPPDAMDERLLAAESWGQLFERTQEPTYGQRSKSILEPMAAGAKPSLEAVFALGVLEEHLNDPGKAESCYRRILAIQPDSMAAQNNLAMVLAKRGKNLGEANTLASAAIKAHPEVPLLYDTLATVQRIQKDYTDAISNMKTAVEMKPDKVSYRVRLAECLAENGQLDQARVVFKGIEDGKMSTSQLTGPEKEELNAVRKLLSITETDSGSANPARISG